MDLTLKEEKLVLRSRKSWYKFFNISRTFLAIVAVALLTFVLAKASADLQDRHAYEAQLEQLAELAARDSLPAQFIPATQFETVEDLLNGFSIPYLTLLDSLELSDKVIGIVVRHNIRPTGVAGFRYGISRMDVFTSCGCDQEGFFALHRLEVDLTLMAARVVKSYEAITLADYLTLNRHSLDD